MKHLRTFVSLSMVVILAGCATSDVIDVAAPVGSRAATVALGGVRGDTGRMTAHLTDGRVLKGNWHTVTGEVPAGGVFVVTPDGAVTAQQLAKPHLPAVTATLGDANTRMVCAFIGDPDSGFRSRCADNSGTRWFGFASEDDHNPDRKWSGFYGHVSIALQELR